MRGLVGADCGVEAVFAYVTLEGVRVNRWEGIGQGEGERVRTYPWTHRVGDDLNVKVGHVAEGLTERQSELLIERPFQLRMD